MRRNIYDLRLAQSGATLHHIGLLMQAEERGEARPVSAEAATRQARCAWCDEAAGRKPSPAMNESHGICARHLAVMRAQLELLETIAA